MLPRKSKKNQIVKDILMQITEKDISTYVFT